MVVGPMPEDRTQVGGVTGSFNTTDMDRQEKNSIESAQAAEDTRNRKRARQQYIKEQEQQSTSVGAERYENPAPPLEQHSPTQIHVPAWKTIVLGGSGGIRVRM